MMNEKDLSKLVQMVGETVEELSKVAAAYQRRDERLKKREAAVKQREKSVASTVNKSTTAQPKLSVETQVVQKSQRDQVVITNLLKGLALISEESYEPNPNMVQLKFGSVNK